MMLSELLATIASLEKSLPRVYRHSLSVTRLSLETAFYINSSLPEIEMLGIAAMLHDLGKMCIPKEILDKPGNLSPKEWKIMKRHPQLGVTMLARLSLPSFIKDCILYHHEWWNGSGYLGIKGREIPKGSRLITICDSWDAMTTSRPYQQQRSVIQAQQEIERMSGKQFDPELAKLFLEIVRSWPPENPEKQLETETTKWLLNRYHELSSSILSEFISS